MAGCRYCRTVYLVQTICNVRETGNASKNLWTLAGNLPFTRAFLCPEKQMASKTHSSPLASLIAGPVCGCLSLHLVLCKCALFMMHSAHTKVLGKYQTTQAIWVGCQEARNVRHVLLGRSTIISQVPSSRCRVRLHNGSATPHPCWS